MTRIEHLPPTLVHVNPSHSRTLIILWRRLQNCQQPVLLQFTSYKYRSLIHTHSMYMQFPRVSRVSKGFKGFGMASEGFHRFGRGFAGFPWVSKGFPNSIWGPNYIPTSDPPMSLASTQIWSNHSSNLCGACPIALGCHT